MKEPEHPYICPKTRYGICIKDISYRNHVALYCGLVKDTRPLPRRFIQIKNYKIAQTDGYCSGNDMSLAKVPKIITFIIHLYQKRTRCIIAGMALGYRCQRVPTK